MTNRSELPTDLFINSDNADRSANDPIVSAFNLIQAERILSLAGGAGLVWVAASRGLPAALRTVLMAVGGYLGYRAITGQHILNTSQSTTSSQVSVPHDKGIRVDKSITIKRPVGEIYAFWHNLENLPRIMHHLESVTTIGSNRTHWVVKAPAGTTVEWDAEIINDVPNERIGWRSLEGASVPNAGSVVFTPAPQDHGTEVKISLKYDPPAGAIGSAIAKLFGEDPALQIQEDLHRLQQLMEAGEIATIQGQTSGREEKDADLRQQLAANKPYTAATSPTSSTIGGTN